MSKQDWLDQAVDLIEAHSAFRHANVSSMGQRLPGPEPSAAQMAIWVAEQFNAKQRYRHSAPRIAEAVKRLNRLNKAAKAFSDSLGGLDEWTLSLLYDFANTDDPLGSENPHGIHLPCPAADDPENQERKLQDLRDSLETIATAAQNASVGLHGKDPGGETDLEVQTRGSELPRLVYLSAYLLECFGIPIHFSPGGVLQSVAQAIHGYATGNDAIDLGDTLRRIPLTETAIALRGKECADDLQALGRIGLAELMRHDREGTTPPPWTAPDLSETLELFAKMQIITRMQLGALVSAPRKRKA